MKRRIEVLNLLILLVLVFGLQTSTQASGFDSYSGGEYFYNNFARIKAINFSDEDKVLAVCQSTPKIPKGWVVVGQENVEDCRNNSIAQPLFNAWLIKKPGKEAIVCRNSPLPDDYVVAGEVKIAACPGGSSLIENKNGWVIRLIE